MALGWNTTTMDEVARRDVELTLAMGVQLCKKASEGRGPKTHLLGGQIRFDGVGGNAVGAGVFNRAHRVTD